MPQVTGYTTFTPATTIPKPDLVKSTSSTINQDPPKDKDKK